MHYRHELDHRDDGASLKEFIVSYRRIKEIEM